MTSSERPGGTVSDSISVTKPYLYGWRTWVSIPLLIGAPEVLCASQVAEIWPSRKRIIQELLGIVNQAPGCALVDVPIHLPDEPLVILRRVEIVDDCRVIDRHGDEIRLMGGEHCPRAVPGGGRAGRELREDGLIPDHRLPALLGEARDDGGRPRVPWAYPFAPRPRQPAPPPRDPCNYVIASCTPPPNPQIGGPWPYDTFASWAIRSCGSAASGSRTRSPPPPGSSRTICGIRSRSPGRNTRWVEHSRRRKSARRCGSCASRWTSSAGP